MYFCEYAFCKLSFLGLRPLDGKVAIVTGSSSGIGEAIARALAENGAKVALAARRKDRYLPTNWLSGSDYIIF